MDRRRKVAVLVLVIALLVVTAGGFEWYRTTDLTVAEDEGEIVLLAANERVDTIGDADARGVAAAEGDDATLAVVYVPESEVAATHLAVVWNVRQEGFWYDVQLEVEPVEERYASFGEPSTTSYADRRLLGGEPTVVQSVSRIHVEYPLGSDQGRLDTTVFASGDASNETVEYEARVTARSIAGDSVDVAVPFEIEYDEL